MRLKKYFEEMRKRNASDLFLKVNFRAAYRIDGRVEIIGEHAVTSGEMEELYLELLNDRQRMLLKENPDLDIARYVEGIGRFRINFLRQLGEPALIVRLVHDKDITFDGLNLPETLNEMIEMPRGLILVTGPAGSGKSTTVAAMIETLNRRKPYHIVTIEDPVEYVYRDDKSFINQRQVGDDTLSFEKALRHVIRQSPDVIVIGEMRDRETIMTAISAAETGHLVISTLHTRDVLQSLNRIVNYYPDYLRFQVRVELSLCLIGIVSQRLIPRSDGPGRIPAVEILRSTPVVRKLLIEGQFQDILDEMKKPNEEGMRAFNQSLTGLVRSGCISRKAGLLFSDAPDELKLRLDGMSTGTDTI